MVSLLTNISAMVAVQTLNAANRDLAAIQRRISTGLKVASPIDDGATYAIAQSMRAQIGSWGVVTQSLARGQSVLDVASAAATAINDLLTQVNEKALAYQDPALDSASKSLLQTDILALADQIDKQAHAANFSGLNLLTNTGAPGIVGRSSRYSYVLPASTLTPQSFLTPMRSVSAATNVQRSMMTTTAYTVPYSPLTPDAFSQPMQSVADGTGVVPDRRVLPGAASVPYDFTLDPSWRSPGRISISLDAFTDPNAVEIWMGGRRVAATGQATAAGGASVGAASAVAGQSVLTFDFAGGSSPVFQVKSLTNNAWAITDVVHAPPASPPPSPPTSTTTTLRSVPTSNPLPPTPLSLEDSGTAPSNGQATYTLNGGVNPGRVDMIFDASLTPDTVNIYQNGVRVAATGQPQMAGGLPTPAAGLPVTGQHVLSFDYIPANGPITFKFNEGIANAGAGWVVGGLVLQSPSDPPPSVPFPTTTTQTANVYVAKQSLDDLTPFPPPTPETDDTRSGTASYSIDAGGNPGRVDMLFDGYSNADVVTIYQNGQPVAASGQPYVPGGGAPASPASPVSGQQYLSFDYDPTRGRNLTIEVNPGQTGIPNAWAVGGLVLQDSAAPLPSSGATTFTYAQPGIIYPHYDLLQSADGGKIQLSSRDLTASGLGLAAMDWTDPASILQTTKAAIVTALSAAAYLGTQSSLLDRLLLQDGKLIDALTAGVGNIVDADVAKESAKLQAAQVRQQLAAKSLAISNASPEWILTLFGSRA